MLLFNSGGNQTMKTKAFIAILLVLAAAAGIGAWYYSSHVSHSPIEKVLDNPRAFEGKTVTIEGDVTDRTAFFNILKFYKVKDKTGEIIVVTKRTPPPSKTKVRVSGRIDEVFAVGDEKLVVLREEAGEEKGK